MKTFEKDITKTEERDQTSKVPQKRETHHTENFSHPHTVEGRKSETVTTVIPLGLPHTSLQERIALQTREK